MVTLNSETETWTERLERLLSTSHEYSEQLRSELRKLPNPGEARFRAWVIGRDPASIHEEICHRLRKRRTLAVWLVGGLWEDPSGGLRPIPPFASFLERMTITAPVARLQGHHVPLLPGSHIMDSPSEPPVETFLTYEQAFDVFSVPIGLFEKRFMSWLWTPSSDDWKYLELYETLLNALRALREQRVPFRLTLKKILDERHTLVLAKRTYQLPADWENLFSALAPRWEVARFLVAREWACDPQTAHERLVELRKERLVRTTWTDYWDWLMACTDKLYEIALTICGDPPIVCWPPSWADIRRP